MTPRPKKKSPPPAATPARKERPVRRLAMIVLYPQHVAALDAEAERRSRLDPAYLAGRRALRPDRSAVLRELVDAWIGSQKGRKQP